jgi:hypothetical protein
MSDLDNALGELLGGLQSRLETWPAVLGDGNGLVAVPNLVKRVYVRMPDGHAAMVFNDDRVPLTNNLPVVVGYDYINPSLFQVLGLRQTYNGNENGGYPSLGMHHASHEYLADHGGQDVVNVHTRQMQVYNSPIFTSSGWKSAALFSIDLTAHVPASGARYVLVSQALDGSLVATAGVTVAIRTYLQLSNIPTPPVNARPIGAVVLEHGQTTITEDRERQDIVDLRFPTFRAWPVTGTSAALPLGATAGSGAGMAAAAWDHVHTHGNQTGGALHATATAGSAGFAPALSGNATDFLNGTGAYSVPAGGSPLSDATPASIGTAAPGTSGSASRGDHVHAGSSTGGGVGHEHGVSRWSGAAGQTVFDLPDYVEMIETVAVGGLGLDPLLVALNDPGDTLTIPALAAAATVQANYVIRTLA